MDTKISELINAFWHRIQYYSNQAARSNNASQMVIHGDFLMGAVLRSSVEVTECVLHAIKPEFGIRSKIFLSPSRLFTGTSQEKVNGDQLAGRSRRCRDDHVISFISDVARYECSLKEQSPVAPLAYLAAPQLVLMPSLGRLRC